MLKRHYGRIVDSEVPITGVLNSGKAEFLYEDCLNGTDVGYEEHLKECPNEEHDECYFNDEPTYLVGFRKNEKTGEFEPDENAEYSAIVMPIYTQVIRSKYVSRVELCSPCFPGQGDLDTPGEFLAYTLPPDVWGDGEHLEITEVQAVHEEQP